MSGLCLDPAHAAQTLMGVPCTRERFVVVEDVLQERMAQDAQYGEQNHPDGTGPDLDIVDDIGHFPRNGNASLAEDAKDRTAALSRVPGRVTYAHILTEEWAEAMAEDDAAKLRAELVQVAAVAVAWVEAIDRRPATE